MPKITTTTAFLVLGLSAATTLGKIVRINGVNDFLEFSKNVNSGIKYEGTTVILDGDIDFTEELSKQFASIGSNITNFSARFRGSFDGQGYTVSNLKMKTSLPYASLFGEVKGNVTIRNIVVDSSCSFESNFTRSVYISGIVGEYFGSTGETFAIENCINMGSLSFTETTNNYLHMGGIIASLSSSGESCIKNCVNYGSVTHSGTVTDTYTYIGGIVGDYRGSHLGNDFFHNCINYGIVSVSGTSKTLYIGGLVGDDDYLSIKNCLSAGSVTTTVTTDNIGIISGRTFIEGTITNCYWTNNVGSYNPSGNGKATVTDSSLIASNDETLTTLNTNAEANSWSKWLLATNDATVSFKANSNGKAIEFSSIFTLIPKFESSWKEFEGWFDGENEFTATTISESKTLTGRSTSRIFTLTFDFGNGTVLNETYGFNDSITYPEVANTEEKVFNRWDKIIERMPNEDTVVRGSWTRASKYVEIIIGKNDISRDEVIEMICRYTPEEFTIKKFEVVEDETRVTVKFVSTTEAAGFINNVRFSSAPVLYYIRLINYVFIQEESSSSESESSSSSKGSTYTDVSSSKGSTYTDISSSKGSTYTDSSSSSISKDSTSISSSLRPLALLFLLR